MLQVAAIISGRLRFEEIAGVVRGAIQHVYSKLAGCCTRVK